MWIAPSSWKTLAARELVPDDIIRIRIGDFVPADVKMIDGEISFDQSTLTVNSLEIDKKTVKLFIQPQ